MPSPRPAKSASARPFSAPRPARLVLPGVASATASGARRARPVHLWRPRRRRPRAHTPHTRAPVGGRGVPLPSLARTPNWLRTVPSGVGGPGAGLTDRAVETDRQTRCREPEHSPLEAVLVRTVPLRLRRAGNRVPASSAKGEETARLLNNCGIGWRWRAAEAPGPVNPRAPSWPGHPSSGYR